MNFKIKKILTQNFHNADDAVTPQDRDSGFMKALLDAGGVRSMFVGHDHGNFFLLTIL